MHTTSNNKDQNHTVLSQQQANVVCCGQYTKAFQQPADFPTAAHDAPSRQQTSYMIIETTMCKKFAQVFYASVFRLESSL